MKMDLCAHKLLALCGFTDPRSFRLDALRSTFKIFGTSCMSDGDFYVVQSARGDLMLVFEDKAERSSAPDATTQERHLGQIAGELLHLLCLNRTNKVFRSVFGVRFDKYHVTCFRVDANKETLAALVKSPDIPAKKLKLQCTHKNPRVERGWSLIDQGERMQALQVMADIRAFMLAQ
jgi:hypothetical protein